MAQMPTFLVKDDASTPVEHTLVPVSDQSGTSFWRGNAAGVPIEGQVRVTALQEKLKNGDYRISVKTEVPVMETPASFSGTPDGYIAPPKVAYVNTAILTVFANRRSTSADRANIIKLAAGLVAGASGTSGSGVLNNASAGDAYKNSTAAIPQFFINLIQPS